jgi:hypothetical protein
MLINNDLIADNFSALGAITSKCDNTVGPELNNENLTGER